jgi:hypothetical protein
MTPAGELAAGDWVLVLFDEPGASPGDTIWFRADTLEQEHEEGYDFFSHDATPIFSREVMEIVRL